MATAQRPSNAEDASRLAATVAREIDLLAARRDRQNELRAQLSDLGTQLDTLDRRRRDVDRLLADSPPPAAGSTPRLLGASTHGRVLRR
jgi:ABC-type transporter Mla subunit MlaD